jgi:hypothetical protein
MSRSIKYLLAIAICSSCHREDSAINSQQNENRLLGAIEITDGETIHWGEQALALKKLKTAGVSYSLGQSAVGMADLWCSSEDYDRALALIGTLSDSNSSGFHSVGDFAGLTEQEVRDRSNEVAHQRDEPTPPHQDGGGKPVNQSESK